MYYFLNSQIGQLVSGIEHAEFKRLKLFKQFGVAAKIVTTEYSAITRRNNAFWQLSEDDFVNLYDFYAGAERVKPINLQLSMLPIANQHYRIEKRETGADFWEGRRQVAAVAYFSKTCTLISTVTYFDGDGQIIRVDVYDERGFLAYAKFMATADAADERYLALEQFYTVTGRPYLEITYRHRGDSVIATNFRLSPKTGAVMSFMTRDQLIAQFYDDLNSRDGEQSTFIADRTVVVNLPMTLMKTAARRIEFIHSSHFSDYRDPINSELVYASLSQTAQLGRTDLIITSTPQQAQDIRERLRTQVPVTHIPVGVVSTEQLRRPQLPITSPSRVRGRIIIVARLFHEKNLSEAILAFQAVQSKLPWLTLAIYGYGDHTDGFQEEQQLRKLVRQFGLTDIVQFMGYTQEMAAVYQQAQLILLTSRLEGFAMALLEANTYGVPAVSYDTYYGPAYLIKNGQNGYVLPYGDREQLSQRIYQLMTNPERLQQLSTGAYQRAQDFSETQVWQAWQRQVIASEPPRK